MPHNPQSNTLQNIFNSVNIGEFLIRTSSTLYLKDLIPQAKELLERMKQEGFKRVTTGNSSKKIKLVSNTSLFHVRAS